MFPYIHLNLGFWHPSVPTFGLMLWVASVAGAYIVDRAFRRAHLDADAVGMVAIAVVAGIIGAKLWHILDTPSDFREMGWAVLWDSGGFAWFGGLVFGIGALVFQGWRAGIGGLRMLDLSAPAAAVGYGIGRIGCFLSGDGDYGIPTSLPWGMAFPNGLVPTTARVHPTPIYELIVACAIAWILWRMGSGSTVIQPQKNGKNVVEKFAGLQPGEVFAMYLILTGVARFLVEFIRINPRSFFGLSNAQAAGGLSALAGIALYLVLRKKPTHQVSA